MNARRLGYAVDRSAERGPRGDTIRRYWETYRHYSIAQIAYYLWFRCRRPRIAGQPAPAIVRPDRHWPAGSWRAPTMCGEMRFRLLGASGTLSGPRSWHDPARSRLWLYHLHYFDDLNASDSDERRRWHHALIDHWVAHNPAGRGVGWESHPLSRRVANWLIWQLRGNTLRPGWRHSLGLQVRWLYHRPEYHLPGNHLLCNAKALVFAGVCLRAADARRWLRRGLAILARQLPRQILADAGHIERSPMYHAIVLEDLLDLLQLDALFPGSLPPAVVADWRALVPRMLRWLASMTHPDGMVGLFNDATLDGAPRYGELLARAEALGLEVESRGEQLLTPLSATGYLRIANRDVVALLDCAPIGPDHLPGHAHADTLSFELSLFGQRVLVNGGTSRYGDGAERQAERGTAAHNTVEIEGEDSSEVWGAFRVARRARPLGLESAVCLTEVEIRCGHDGYRRLSGRPTHWRRWRLRARSLEIVDRIDGDFTAAVARFHLHPDVALCAQDAGTLELMVGAKRVRLRFSGGEPRVVDSIWRPTFGRTLASRCIELQLANRRLSTVLDWR